MISITAFTKEKTAKIIPNAVAVSTTEDTHTFTSFISREATYKVKMLMVLTSGKTYKNIWKYDTWAGAGDDKSLAEGPLQAQLGQLGEAIFSSLILLAKQYEKVLFIWCARWFVYILLKDFFYERGIFIISIWLKWNGIHIGWINFYLRNFWLSLSTYNKIMSLIE